MVITLNWIWTPHHYAISMCLSFWGAFLSCVDSFKHEFAEQLTADAKRMYQAVMDGLYQKVSDTFASKRSSSSAADHDQKQMVALNLNFKSPYVALPKYLQSNEFLFGQLGAIAIQNRAGSLEQFIIGIK